MGTESVPNVTTTGDSSHSDTESRMNTPAREKAVTTTDSQSTRLSLHGCYKQGFTTIKPLKNVENGLNKNISFR